MLHFTRHLRSLPALDRTADQVRIETDDHETIELQGCSEAEVDAKLKDYLAWAS